jgi:1-deoxy-D-xylulose-5-phosphate synthase
MKLELESLSGPEELRLMSPEHLTVVAKKVRTKIIETVSEFGGHLGSSLGVVELTIALHTVFDTPRDKIVWDVGHQTYAHKLITGRASLFHTLRKKGGLSGYPKRQESPYDVYDTGHASGSISYALGLAKARDLKNEDYHVVAVIGDGALTGGLAYEGLNNAGEQAKRLIVILNDNSMSISENVGGISYYLTTLRLAPVYRSTKARIEKVLAQMPALGPKAGRLLKRIKGSIKHFLFPEEWFESLGFRYYGPIDGHDIEGLQRVLRDVKKLEEPVIVHVITEKGKGYKPAQERPDKFHGVGPFDVATGEAQAKSGPPSYSRVFGAAISKFAEKEQRIVAITAAMAEGTGLSDFSRKFPNRFVDVGIAEGHAVTYAAGLAQGGLIPVVAIYSSFLQRAFDQVIEDVCLQNLKVVFAIDRAGIVGEDGETHQGEFDLSYLRIVPNLTVMAPRDERELVNMLYTAIHSQGPCALRYPRGKGVGTSYRDVLENPQMLPIGKSEEILKGRDVNILALGSMVQPSIDAAKYLRNKGVSCGVYNARFIKPLDINTVLNLSRDSLMVTVEENVGAGGLGEAVLAALSGKDEVKNVRCISLPDRFIEHDTQSGARKTYGLDGEGIAAKIEEFLVSDNGDSNHILESDQMENQHALESIASIIKGIFGR